MPGIFVAGHNGMVGSAITRRLLSAGEDVHTMDRADLDLFDAAAVHRYLGELKPDALIVAAAKVGGIHANNTFPAEFIVDNLVIETNLIQAAYQAGCHKLLFLGSSCIYPKLADQPMKEAYLLAGPLEPTNEPYAIAKIAGIKLCESYNRQYGTDYRCVMPTNLYGPGDNFHGENSHVAPALMRRLHEAKNTGSASATVWGTGTVMRELLHVDDLADACAHVLQLERSTLESVTTPMCSHINIGTGVDITIRELAETIARIVGFKGELVFDASKPDGTPRKLLDVSKINTLGWSSRISLEDGLRSTYDWFLQNTSSIRQ